MDLFRSSLFIAIVSLFVLTGYAYEVLDYDCDTEKREQVSKGDSHSGKQTPAKTDHCQCLCHQIFNFHMAAPVRIGLTHFTRTGFVALVDEFPPDAVPLGIDYPPQLA